MYIFYADESGFSKGSGFEKEQPITVVAGILIDLTKLTKAIRVFDGILEKINQGEQTHPITELKFADIRQGKYPYKKNFPKVEKRADLLRDIILAFEQEIAFKIIYTAIDDALFLESKLKQTILKTELHHPYLCAAYRVLAKIEKYQAAKSNNKGKTFVVFDEQNSFQGNLERLIAAPLHCKRFEQIFDTVYFGKSQHSKLIQIADLIAGIIRYYLWRVKTDKADDYWVLRLKEVFEAIEKNVIEQECFEGGNLREIYREICIKKAPPK